MDETEFRDPGEATASRQLRMLRTASISKSKQMQYPTLEVTTTRVSVLIALSEVSRSKYTSSTHREGSEGFYPGRHGPYA